MRLTLLSHSFFKALHLGRSMLSCHLGSLPSSPLGASRFFHNPILFLSFVFVICFSFSFISGPSMLSYRGWSAFFFASGCPAGYAITILPRQSSSSISTTAPRLSSTNTSSSSTSSSSSSSYPDSLFSVGSKATCLPCPAGSFSSQADSWTCTPCPRNTYNPSLSATTCYPCALGYSANTLRGQTSCDSCSQDYEPVYDSTGKMVSCISRFHLWAPSRGALYAVEIISSVVFLCALTALIWIVYRSYIAKPPSAVLSAASPLFLIITILGEWVALCYVHIQLFFPLNDLQCQIGPFMPSIAFALCFGSLIAKTWRWVFDGCLCCLSLSCAFSVLLCLSMTPSFLLLSSPPPPTLSPPFAVIVSIPCLTLKISCWPPSPLSHSCFLSAHSSFPPCPRWCCYCCYRFCSVSIPYLTIRISYWPPSPISNCCAMLLLLSSLKVRRAGREEGRREGRKEGEGSRTQEWIDWQLCDRHPFPSSACYSHSSSSL